MFSYSYVSAPFEKRVAFDLIVAFSSISLLQLSRHFTQANILRPSCKVRKNPLRISTFQWATRNLGKNFLFTLGIVSYLSLFQVF